MPTDNLDPEIDWSRRADGKAYTLVRGEHYTRDSRMVRRAAGMWASRHGFRCLTDLQPRVKPNQPEALIVKFLPKQGKV